MSFRFILFFYIFFSTNLFAHNIATINLNFIYDSSVHYLKFMDQLSAYKNQLENEIREEENELLKIKNNIESNKYILNKKELSKLTKKYESEFNNLQTKLENFNINISNNISNSQQILNNEIIIISQQISSKNNLSLIIENTNFFIANDQIDISKNIIEILNKKVIDINILPL